MGLLYRYTTIIIIVFLALTDAQLVKLAKKVNFHNVSLLQQMTFSENSSLIDDMRTLDQAYENLLKLNQTKSPGKSVTNISRTTMAPVSEQSKQVHVNATRSITTNNIQDTVKIEKDYSTKNDSNSLRDMSQLEIRLILIGDYSLYEKFLQLYRDDDFVTYNAIHQYLNGIYEQIRIIFSRFIFFGKYRIDISVADIIPIFRAEDCPFRGPYIRSQYIKRHGRERFGNYTIDGDRKSSSNKSSSNGKANAWSVASNSSSDVSFDEYANDDYENDNNYVDLSNMSWTHIHGLTAIHMINLWTMRNSHLFSSYEHVLVITNYDLMSINNDSATQGMAYVRAMCRDAYSTSVVEDVGGLATATVSAHEIIHSLGAFHDNMTSQRENFLMAPSLFSADYSDNFPNAFRLSGLSIRDVEAFLNSSDSDCLRSRPKSETTTKSPAYYYDDEVIRYFDDDYSSRYYPFRVNNVDISTIMKQPKRQFSWLDDNLPQEQFLKKTTKNRVKHLSGQLFDINQQCRIAFGRQYGKCQKREIGRSKISAVKKMNWRDQDTCHRLWCINRRLWRQSICETKAFLPLMDGTPCGDNQWCISGTCVPQLLIDEAGTYGTKMPQSF